MGGARGAEQGHRGLQARIDHAPSAQAKGVFGQSISNFEPKNVKTKRRKAIREGLVQQWITEFRRKFPNSNLITTPSSNGVKRPSEGPYESETKLDGRIGGDGQLGGPNRLKRSRRVETLPELTID